MGPSQQRKGVVHKEVLEQVEPTWPAGTPTQPGFPVESSWQV
jgi:hypothetical protein